MECLFLEEDSADFLQGGRFVSAARKKGEKHNTVCMKKCFMQASNFLSGCLHREGEMKRCMIVFFMLKYPTRQTLLSSVIDGHICQ